MSRARAAQHSLEILVADTALARTAQDVAEVLQAYTVGAAPTGSFGVALTQDVIEVLVAAVVSARMNQVVIEVLISETEASGGGSGGTRSFGYAV